MNIANCLTFIRVFISPIFLLLYMQHDWFYINDFLLPYVLLFLMSVSEISDALDGYLARKYDQVTDLGKLLDPMADSITHIGVLLAFTQGPIQLPLLIVFVFLYRDSVVSTLRTICALKGFALAARPSGKVKSVLLGVVEISIVVLMIPHSLGLLSTDHLQTISITLTSICACYAAYSGFDYIFNNWTYVRKLLSTPSQTADETI